MAVFMSYPQHLHNKKHLLALNFSANISRGS